MRCGICLTHCSDSSVSLLSALFLFPPLPSPSLLCSPFLSSPPFFLLFSLIKEIDKGWQSPGKPFLWVFWCVCWMLALCCSLSSGLVFGGLKSTSQCETRELLRSAGHSPVDKPCQACRTAVKLSCLLLPLPVQKSAGGSESSLVHSCCSWFGGGEVREEGFHSPRTDWTCHLSSAGII